MSRILKSKELVNTRLATNYGGCIVISVMKI